MSNNNDSKSHLVYKTKMINGWYVQTVFGELKERPMGDDFFEDRQPDWIDFEELKTFHLAIVSFFNNFGQLPVKGDIITTIDDSNTVYDRTIDTSTPEKTIIFTLI